MLVPPSAVFWSLSFTTAPTARLSAILDNVASQSLKAQSYGVFPAGAALALTLHHITSS